MNWLQRRSNTPIGIDLDGRSIRAVQLSRSSRGWCIQAAVAMPRQRFDVPVTADEVAALARELAKHGFTGHDVVVAVPARNLLSAIIDLPPRSSGAPVERIALSELARMHECDMRAIEMASWSLPQPVRAANSTPTMVCACPYSDSEALLKLFERCGLHVLALDTRSRALVRACTPILADPRAIVAVVDLEWDQAHVVAMQEGLVAYDRALPDAGTERLIETLVSKSRLDRPAAEAVFAEAVLDPANANHEGTKRARKPVTRVEMHTDMVADELSSPLTYLANQYPDAQVREVVLTGPCSQVGALAEYMSARLDIDVRAVTPQHMVDVSEAIDVEAEKTGQGHPVDAGAMVAMGLAQYGADKGAGDVNLIPSPKRLAAQRRRRTRSWVAACAVYAAMLAAVYVSCRFRWGGNDLQGGEMARISADIDRYKGQRVAVKGAIMALRAKIDANNAVGQQPDWSILLALLARNLGSDVVLKHCELDLDRPGRAPDADQGDDSPRRNFVLEVNGLGRTQTAVSAFVLRLEKAGLFDQVKLIRTSREDFMSGKAVSFQLACTLRAERRRSQ